MNTTSIRHSFHEALDDSFAAMKVFIQCIDKIDGWKQGVEKQTTMQRDTVLRLIISGKNGFSNPRSFFG